MVPTGRGVVAAGARVARGAVAAGGAGGAGRGLAGGVHAPRPGRRARSGPPFASPEHILFGVSLLSWMQWMAEQPWSIALRESLFVWPLLESTHVLTLMLFVGTAAMLDLRLLGVTFRGVPASEFTGRLLPWTRASFVADGRSPGVLLFYATPVRYYQNIFFRVKVLLLVAAGLNIWLVPLARASARAGLGSGHAAAAGRAPGGGACRSWPGRAWSSPGGWWPTTGSTATCSRNRRS